MSEDTPYSSKFNLSLPLNVDGPGVTEDNDKEHLRVQAKPANALAARWKHFFIRVLVVSLGMYALSRLRPVRICSPHFNLWCRNASSSVGPTVRGGLPTHYALPSGDAIPAVALDVWKAQPGEVGAAVEAALKTGYRHIDDAWAYNNEVEVGKAIKKSGVPRSEIWLTSKLWNSFHAPEDVEPALDDSLNKLGTEYLDLYLIHWPIAFKREKGSNGKKFMTRS